MKDILFYKFSAVEVRGDTDHFFVYKNKIHEVVKLDDRYMLGNEILYPYEFAAHNMLVAEKTAPYAEFIEKHLLPYENIKWCSRCQFNVFEFLAEDNHGGWFNECDNYPNKCSDPIYEKYEVPCQRCDYALCDDCERNTFDEKNAEFCILRNALLVSAEHAGIGENINEIIGDFPSGGKLLPDIARWLRDCVESPPPSKSYRDIWIFADRYVFELCLEAVEQYGKCSLP